MNNGNDDDMAELIDDVDVDLLILQILLILLTTITIFTTTTVLLHYFHIILLAINSKYTFTVLL